MSIKQGETTTWRRPGHVYRDEDGDEYELLKAVHGCEGLWEIKLLKNPSGHLYHTINEYTMKKYKAVLVAAYASPPAPVTPGRVMEVEVVHGFTQPLHCIHCGGKKRRGQTYTCDTCVDLYPLWKEAADDFDKGARDFPREPRPQAMTGPSDSSLARSPEASGRASGPAAAAVANPDRSTAVAAAGVTRREVSPDGRAWLNYDVLIDPDPFESYRHRKVNGAYQAKPLNMCGVNFASGDGCWTDGPTSRHGLCQRHDFERERELGQNQSALRGR